MKQDFRLFLIIFLISFPLMARAQEGDVLFRYAINFIVPLTKKLDLKIGHLSSYKFDKFRNNLNLKNLRLSYDVNKKVSLSAGIALKKLSSSSRNLPRFVVGGDHKIRLLKKLSWKNSIQLEAHTKKEKKFRNRIIIGTRLGLRKKLDFLKLSPTIGYTLYYNIGGNKIQYYDNSYQPVIIQSPQGFHRGRFTVNLHSKINRQISLSVYYFRQNEFNLFTQKYRGINVVKPNGDITR